jgi:hypothetical protein
MNKIKILVIINILYCIFTTNNLVTVSKSCTLYVTYVYEIMHQTLLQSTYTLYLTLITIVQLLTQAHPVATSLHCSLAAELISAYINNSFDVAKLVISNPITEYNSQA